LVSVEQEQELGMWMRDLLLLRWCFGLWHAFI